MIRCAVSATPERRPTLAKAGQLFRGHTPRQRIGLAALHVIESPDMLLSVARYLMNSSAVVILLPANWYLMPDDRAPVRRIPVPLRTNVHDDVATKLSR